MNHQNPTSEAGPTYPALPPTPELDKMAQVRAETEIAADFFGWLHETGHRICKVVDSPSAFAEFTRPDHWDVTSPNQLLADWKGIDLDAVERERSALLHHARQCNDIRETWEAGQAGTAMAQAEAAADRRVLHISDADAQLLSGHPAPLTVMHPVTIEDRSGS